MPSFNGRERAPTSLAQRMARTARAVRYAVNAAAHVNQQEALRNYLLLVSRAHGLGPRQAELADQHGDPLLAQLLGSALVGGDHAALAASLDHLQELTDRPTPTPGQLGGMMPQNRDPRELHPSELLAALHHRILGARLHGQPLDITSMFSRGGLAGAGVTHAPAQAFQGFQNQGYRMGPLRAGAQKHPGTLSLIDHLVDHGRRLYQEGEVDDLAHYHDLLQQLGQSHIPAIRRRARPINDAVHQLLGQTLGNIEQHHLG